MGRSALKARLGASLLALAVVVGAGACRREVETEHRGPVENLTHVTSEAQFDKILKTSGTPALVDLYATWCPPCRKLAPVLDRLAPRYKGKVAFLKVNVDHVPGLARRFGVRAIPTLLFLKGGKVADRIVGAPPERRLRSALDALAR